MPENLPIEPQAIIFIVIVLIGFVRSVFFSKKKKKPQQQWEEEEWEEENYQEERAMDPMAEFRQMIEEAKAQAQESQTSPPQQQPSQTAKPQTPPPPPKTTQPAPAQVTSNTHVTPPPSRAKAAQKPIKKKTPKNSIKDLLSSPSAAKQAIILTEVLGKPKAYRKG